MSRKRIIVKFSVYALLSVLPFVVYYSVAGYEFLTTWDDRWMVFNRYTVAGLNKYNIVAIFSNANQGQYSPVNQLIYTMIYHVFGADPQIFHLANVFYHAINTCLVFAFVKMLLGFRERESVRLVSIAAFITAVLFAVHPLNTEAVAWISASKVSLYTLFGLSALLCYMRYLKSGKKKMLTVSFALFVLSFLCKEQALVIPFVIPLIDWFAGRSLRDKKLWFEKIPLFVFILFGCFYTLSLRDPILIEFRAGYPLWQRLIFACYALTEYLTKLILPVNLMYIYPFPMAPGDPLPQRFLIYPVIVMALAGVVIYYRKYAVLVFGALFFLLNISLTLHIISMSRMAIVADRYVYLSEIGFFMPLVWYGVQYMMRLSKYKKIVTCIFFASYLFYLTGYAMKHSNVWRNDDSLKKDLRELLEKRKEAENKEYYPKVEQTVLLKMYKDFY